MSRRIVHGVRDGKKTYKQGDEAALAAVATADQIKRLLVAGAIVGDWSGAVIAKPVVEPASVSRETLPPDPLVALHGLGIDIIGTLIEAGYDTPEAIRVATDAELEALPKIGPATVAKIRAALD